MEIWIQMNFVSTCVRVYVFGPGKKAWEDIYQNVSNENLREGRITGFYFLLLFLFFFFYKNTLFFLEVDMGGERYTTSRPQQ